MPQSLYISKANAVSFVILTSPGTIGASQPTTDFNYLHQDKSDYWNCNLDPNDYCQSYIHGDQITFQFIGTFDVAIPFVNVYDSSGALVIEDASTFAMAVLPSGETPYRVLIDTSVLPVPSTTACDCYVIKLESIAFDDTNLFVCADFGRFETGAAFWGAVTGGNNIMTQDNTHVHAGAEAGLITADVAPAGGSDVPFQCNNALTFSPNTFYKYSGWGYQEAATPFIDPLDELEWDISGFTDAVTIASFGMRGNQLNKWVNFWIVFKTGSDVTQTPRLTIGMLPLSNGQLWIDQFELFEGDYFTEAVSQCVEVCDNLTCSLNFTYYPNAEKVEMGLSGGSVAGEGTGNFNIECNCRTISFTDDAYEITKDSSGTTSLIVSEPEKVYTFKTMPMPAYMVEKITLALKVSNFFVRAAGTTNTKVQLIMRSKAPQVEASTAEATMFTMEWDMVLQVYDYTRSNC